jgi:hypothetical protein
MKPLEIESQVLRAADLVEETRRALQLSVPSQHLIEMKSVAEQLSADTARAVAAFRPVGLKSLDDLGPASLLGESFTSVVQSLAESVRPLTMADLGRQIAEAMERQASIASTIASVVSSIDLSGFLAASQAISKVVLELSRPVNSINWAELQSFGAGRKNVFDTAHSLAELSRRHWQVLDSATEEGPSTRVIILPSAVEVSFAHRRSVRILTDDWEEEAAVTVAWNQARDKTIRDVEGILEELDKGLLDAWRGALETAGRRRSDWMRQSAISFRTVLERSLNLVAPPTAISKHQKSGGRSGRREAQVDYLCSTVESSAQGRAVVCELRATVDMFDLLNEIVHKERAPIPPESFDSAVVGLMKLLWHILVLWRERQGP